MLRHCNSNSGSVFSVKDDAKEYLKSLIESLLKNLLALPELHTSPLSENTVKHALSSVFPDKNSEFSARLLAGMPVGLDFKVQLAPIQRQIQALSDGAVVVKDRDAAACLYAILAQICKELVVYIGETLLKNRMKQVTLNWLLNWLRDHTLASVSHDSLAAILRFANEKEQTCPSRQSQSGCARGGEGQGRGSTAVEEEAGAGKSQGSIFKADSSSYYTHTHEGVSSFGGGGGSAKNTSSPERTAPNGVLKAVGYTTETGGCQSLGGRSRGGNEDGDVKNVEDWKGGGEGEGGAAGGHALGGGVKKEGNDLKRARTTAKTASETHPELVTDVFTAALACMHAIIHPHAPESDHLSLCQLSGARSSRETTCWGRVQEKYPRR